MRMSAYFYGAPGDPRDQACRAIFEQQGAKRLGAGTMMVGANAGERDQEWEVDGAKAEATRAALRRAGFRVRFGGEPCP
jgi:hypothetical protein